MSALIGLICFVNCPTPLAGTLNVGCLVYPTCSIKYGFIYPTASEGYRFDDNNVGTHPGCVGGVLYLLLLARGYGYEPYDDG